MINILPPPHHCNLHHHLPPPSGLPTVGVFAKATAQDTPKAVVTRTDEAIRR